LSGEAEIEKGADEGGSLAPGTSSAGTRPAVDDHGAAGGPALKLPGYVDALEKHPLFTPADVMGYITQIVPQYARVEEGDVVLESTGDRARATLEEVADTPELAQGRLKVAKTALETDVTRRELAKKGADLEVKAAELRLAKLESLPREPSVKMAEAKVRRAELELARAGQLLEVARAAGLYSEHDLERKELDARLAELQLEEEKVRLALVRKGAAKEDLERARFMLDYARQEVGHVERRSAQWAELLDTLYAEAEVGLANGVDVVQEFQRRLDQRILRAPVAGNVVLEPLDRARGRTLALGDYLPQWPLSVGHVCDLAKLKFCAVVEQTDLSHIEVGDKASVELLAIPARSFQGTVSAVMPLVIDREEVRTPDTRPPKLSGVRSTRVDILLDVPEDGNARILPGMTGTATLLMRGSAA
jgi:multidrug resistance efflux pump